jgi:hypothetical protein
VVGIGIGGGIPSWTESPGSEQADVYVRIDPDVIMIGDGKAGTAV